MERIQILTGEDPRKLQTRSLYEQAFDDPAVFVDYYYREKCKDNKMVVLEDDGRVLSMLHLNPYRMMVCGNGVPAYYVVAVATDKHFRRQGHMRRVLQAAFFEMERDEIPFCFLMPVNENIYTPFGFRTVCEFIPFDHPLAKLSYDEVQARYDVYCIQDAVYNRRRAREDALAQEDNGEVLPEHPVIMVRPVRGFARGEAGNRLFSERAQGAETGELRCYFREEV